MGFTTMKKHHHLRNIVYFVQPPNSRKIEVGIKDDLPPGPRIQNVANESWWLTRNPGSLGNRVDPQVYLPPKNCAKISGKIRGSLAQSVDVAASHVKKIPSRSNKTGRKSGSYDMILAKLKVVSRVSGI